MVRHAGQPLGLKAKTNWQGVLVLHGSGEQGMARRDTGKAACERMGENGGEKQQVVKLLNKFMSQGRLNFFSHGITSVKQHRVGWILLDRAMAHRRLQSYL